MQELPVKVGWILYKKDEEWKILYLLLKRTEEDWGFWQYMTGTLHEGESFLGCLKREMNEEVGIVDNEIISIDPMFFSFTWNKKDWRLIHDFTYSVHISATFLPKISPLEHDEYKWEEFDDAIEILYTDNNKAALKKLYKIQNESVLS